MLMDWYFDWDGTITQKDTLSLLASIGYQQNANHNLPPWSFFSEAYTSGLKRLQGEYQRSNDTQTLENYIVWQTSLLDVERASVERVEEAGVFNNVTATEVDSSARVAVESKTIRFRNGLASLLEYIARSTESLTIISVHWSARFIRACLETASEFHDANRTLSIKVLANEIDVTAGSGKLAGPAEQTNHGIRTASDKATVLEQEIDRSGRHRPSVYVGDSVGDLQCLLKADIGICVRHDPLSHEQQHLSTTLSDLGIDCDWIGQYTVQAFRVERQLWWAKDFQEVQCSPLLGKTVQDALEKGR